MDGNHEKRRFDTGRDPVEVLAEEFAARFRRGERASVDEYVESYPEYEEEIRAVFPAVLAMEKLKISKESKEGSRASLGPAKLEQLGDFRIVRELGRGGMGVVFEAVQESLDRRVAVKVLPRQHLLDSRQLDRFEKEAKTAGRHGRGSEADCPTAPKPDGSGWRFPGAIRIRSTPLWTT